MDVALRWAGVAGGQVVVGYCGGGGGSRAACGWGQLAPLPAEGVQRVTAMLQINYRSLPYTELPRRPANCPTRSCTTAEEATRALLHAAHRGWADAYQGSHCDDCTIAVAFLS